MAGNREITRVEAHTDELYCIDFNPLGSNVFVTGSVDSSVALWDIRKPEFKLYAFERHSEPVDYSDSR